MQSGKNTKKIQKAAEPKLAGGETLPGSEAPKARKRVVKAAVTAEPATAAKAASRATKTTATAGSTAKSTHHRASKRVAPPMAEVEAIVAARGEAVHAVVTPEPVTAAELVQEAAPLAMAAAVGATAPRTGRSVSSAQIAELAYSYYVARGYKPGNPDEDWFRAERELRGA